MLKQDTFRMRGQIKIGGTGEPAREVPVSVLDKGFLCDDRLGMVFTDKKGFYDISYSRADFPEFFEARPEMYIIVKAFDGSIFYRSEESVLLEAGKFVSIDLEIPKSAIEQPTASGR